MALEITWLGTFAGARAQQRAAGFARRAWEEFRFEVVDIDGPPMDKILLRRLYET